jgi:hypothetical protein
MGKDHIDEGRDSQERSPKCLSAYNPGSAGATGHEFFG